ncbi:RNA demethylase ALKBH5-like [Phalaenopsis equestris]|uniref:RNA demethylase ALKBH5-like n=1 Tax=Phalaenopsis equestris TaxID=78828 RepID=UPI0009E625B5|nr:RNA demethylase ALKBH5-like [Phalaenopsis equestris]
MPPTIKWMVTRLVQWRIMPSSCIPNSCIINIYEEGDCIPPHIDHHDFERPFCTVSFVSESSILFGTDIDITGPGEFRGSVEISLPRGSVLILKGNGADITKHCIPGVRHRRVSITFRRMIDDKTPYGFQPDPELEQLQPYEL